MATLNTTATHFDSPERSTRDQIAASHRLISMDPVIMQLLNGLPDLVVIIDHNRQIVATNEAATKVFGLSGVFDALGMRVGEAVGCVHSFDEPAGCGTSKFCAECGAAQAIRNTIANQIMHSEECVINTSFKGDERQLMLRVSTSPIHIGGERFTLFSIKDIAHEKRKENLERIFFHDVLNSSNVVSNLAEIAEDIEDEEERRDVLRSLIKTSRHLQQEILTQRELRNAENGKLSIQPEEVSVNGILHDVHAMYRSSELAEEKQLIIEEADESLKIRTDKMLLERSLGNLTKNALEAVAPGEKVKLYAETLKDRVMFCVYNDGVIPDNIQLRIFNHSFSTKKGAGRGVGTYSVKLLVEKYLDGKVFFISNESEQTVFSIIVSFDLKQ